MSTDFTDNRSRKNLALVFALLASASSMIAITAFNPEDIHFKLVALLLFFVCIFLGLRDGCPFSPFFLFSITPLSLALYEYKFSTYYLDRLSPYVYILALCSIAAFIAGLALLTFQVKNHIFSGERPGENRLFWPLLLLGMSPVVFGILMAPRVFFSGNFLGVSEYVGRVPMSSVFMLCRYPALSLALKSKSGKRITVSLLCCLLALILSFNKSNLAFFIFAVLVSVHRYCLSNQSAKRIFRLLCVASIVLLFASVTFYDDIRGDFDSTQALVRTGSSGLPEFLMLPYMYLESSWTNLQYVIETQPVHTFGLWLVRPLLFYLRVDGAFDDAYTLVPASSYNTYTYITIPWKDFGFIGAVVISFLLGLFVSYVYQKFRADYSPFWTAAYALNAVAVFEMFFSNHFFYLVYPFTACIIALICDAYVGHGVKRHGAEGASRFQLEKMRIEKEGRC